jgi:CheY-like chemotaxis protein
MRGSVLVVEDDPNLATLVAEVLGDEGFVVSLLDPRSGAIRAEVACLEPDVVLLDGPGGTGYGSSWTDAVWLHEREHPIPVIMFTGHAGDLAEARCGASERSQRAAFAGLLAKPFELEALVELVARAVEQPAAVSRC